MSALMRVLAERWVLTLATNAPDLPDLPDLPSLPAAPHVAPLFYAVCEPGELAPGPTLVFTSRPGTRHGRHLGQGPTPAAAAVYLETETIGCIRGVQMRGSCIAASRLPPTAHRRARAAYVARHPVAAELLAKDPPAHALYCLAVEWAKLTDNRVGFGVHPQWRFAHPWPGHPEPESDVGEIDG